MNKLPKTRQTRLPFFLSILALGTPFLTPYNSAIARSLSVDMSGQKDLYRADGVRIGYDPYSKEMLEKYGSPGETDSEGFNPYSDSVGAGIYGGRVKRDDKGEIIVGEQYQNHNSNPGPVYAGGGYTPMINSLRRGEAEISKLIDKYPDLVNEISTGGATPLHMCGMSNENQKVTAFLIKRGANIEAIDTYGFTPLHRMASNNLAIGAEALLEGKALLHHSLNAACQLMPLNLFATIHCTAGADPEFKTIGRGGETAMKVARDARAYAVITVLQKYIK